MCEHNRVQYYLESLKNRLNFVLNRQNLPHKNNTDIAKNGQRRRGQVVVEYVLLLVIAVGIAGLVMRSCVSRNEDQAGVIIQFWDEMLRVIGSDEADEP